MASASQENAGDGIKMAEIGFEGIERDTGEGNLYPTVPSDGANGQTPGDRSRGDPTELTLLIPKEGYDNTAFVGDGDPVNDSENLVKSTTSVDMTTPNKDTMFFRDEVRRIDYVLAYRLDKDPTSKKAQEKEGKRERFEASLRKEGLQLEIEDKELSQDGETYFIKLHAPWEVLLRYAELMNIKMPLKVSNNVPENTVSCYSCYQCVKKIPNPFDIDRELIPEEPDYFTAPFKRSRMNEFAFTTEEEFFSNAQRSRMVHEVLARARYDDGKEDKAKIGIKKLLAGGSYVTAYPLHDGPAVSEHSVITEGILNQRHLLYTQWAWWRKWYKYQPADAIRSYFGEKVGIYFVWLGFYTSMLIPASIIGFIVFIYGISIIFTDPTSTDICDPNGAGAYVMCPLCDTGCGCWHLNNSCLYSRASIMFDNGATVFFAIFMSLWATFFMEFWKRKNAELEYDWDVADFEEEEQNIRPEYEISVKSHRINPVTNQSEPRLHFVSRLIRVMSSFAGILFMIFLVLAAVFGIIVYRIIVVSLIYSGVNDDLVKSNASLLTTTTAAILSLLVIILLNKLYERIAQFLTNLEMPRTDTEWEDSFTFKMFLFQCVNYYSTIFYIAFFKGRLTGSPGNYNMTFGVRGEECDPAGCLIELAIQLAIVMVGKQALNNAQEVIIPVLMLWLCKKKKEETEENKYTSWERDFDLAELPPHGLFGEYLEMVVQFGFVTLFVAAFPLAPFFALLNNILEIRIDASKYARVWKRPMAARAQDIGVWFWILNALATAAVLINGLIIAITSDFVNKLVFNVSRELGVTQDTSYVDWSLSHFPIANYTSRTNLTNDPLCSQEKYCRYRDFRDTNTSSYTLTWWHVMAAKLAFILVFEHFVFGVTAVIAWLIPDVPTTVKYQILREKHLAKEALFNREKILREKKGD